MKSWNSREKQEAIRRAILKIIRLRIATGDESFMNDWNVVLCKDCVKRMREEVNARRAVVRYKRVRQTTAGGLNAFDENVKHSVVAIIEAAENRIIDGRVQWWLHCRMRDGGYRLFSNVSDETYRRLCEEEAEYELLCLGNHS